MSNKLRRELDDGQIEIIRSMANHNLSVTDVGRELYRHRNTVVYHLDNIKKETGKDPRVFVDLISLLREIGEMPGEVNVVRCRGCKHSRPINREDPFEKRFAYGCFWCTRRGEGMMPDDFCSYGKREGGDGWCSKSN